MSVVQATHRWASSWRSLSALKTPVGAPDRWASNGNGRPDNGKNRDPTLQHIPRSRPLNILFRRLLLNSPLLSPTVLKGAPTFSTFYLLPLGALLFSRLKENKVFPGNLCVLVVQSWQPAPSRFQVVQVRVERVRGCASQLQALGSGQVRVGETIDKTMSYLKMGHHSYL